MITKCYKLAAGVAVATALLVGGPASAQDRTGWPSSIKIGTASQGGTYFIYGAGWGNLVQESLKVTATPEVTGGPVQNMAMVHSGDLQFGMVTMGPAYEGWVGESELAPGMKMDNVRAMFPMYETPFHMIALARSNITKVADLNGKTVGVSPRGGTAGTYFPRFFQDLGINVRAQYGGASDQAGQLQDGLLDTFAFAAGVPISAFSQVEAQTPAVVFAFNEEEIQTLLNKYPSLSEFTIPAGTYRSVTTDLPTVSMWNFAIANKDVPASMVYEIMKTVLDNNDRMVEIHRSALETLPENMVHNKFLPFHAGAVRYFQEKGIEVPAELIPAEYQAN
ncbi:TAXI family TRAP transporter solute-binding subunit [Telmatospirillum sp. J64-1]|uniref:TAXI family TRAP transporter solute-binding subunit n=1 Tax=Telmatospirillum sp. J64-1 TaxID=2502183 RepID=UPI00115E2173|nr:TAXI family TRAP transporter solute-binding subunit [Telmatospirillum sp. J64-1]